MIQKVYKGSDLIIDLALKDRSGNTYRVTDVMGFVIKFYTTDPMVNVECSKLPNEQYFNIIKNESTDSAVLNSSDLNKLNDGLLHYEYHIRVMDSSFDDNIYDEIVTGETNLFLKSKPC